MATNKNAQIRYKILDECFRNTGRRYFIENLMEVCDRKLVEINPDYKGISRRQIFDDIAFMESAEGWEIELEEGKDGKRRFYRYADTNYSINNMPLSETEINRLLSTLQTLSQFKGMPQLEWMYELMPKLTQGNIAVSPVAIMEFDTNLDLQGIEHIGTVYDAILYKKVLQIRYMQAFKNEVQLVFHPYYLKQYNNRWFLFGYNPEYDKFDINLPLDRIIEINELKEIFIPNEAIDWEEYFDDMLGVSKPENAEAEEIILHFFGKTSHYIASKPIAGCQKHHWIDVDTLEVKLKLIINYELERFILSYADSVKVIQPEFLIDTIKKRMKHGYYQYG